MANLQMMQQQADLYNQQMAKYGQAAQEYNMASDVYNRQVKEYQALVDAYNTNPAVVKYNEAVKNYNDVLVPQYNKSAADYNKKVGIWKSGSVTMNVPLLGNRTTTPEKMYEMLQSYARNGSYAASQVSGNLKTLQQNYYPGAAPPSPAKPTEPNVQKPGDFTAQKPEMTVEMPKDPGFTGQQMKQLLGEQTLAQREKTGEGEVGLINRVQGKKQQSDSIIGGLLQNVRYST